jgi:hypothetical protein
MFKGFWSFAFFILLSATGTAAQSPRPGVRPATEKPPERLPAEDQQELSHLPDEMRSKMAIRRAEGEHRKVLEDVEKLSDLADEIAKGYGERKQLSPDDLKRLSTIEKLAKHVLTHAGGDEVDDKSVTNEHMPLADAIDKLNTVAATIRKDMKAETRFVVSATVIANSNEVIALARFIRRNQKAD